MAKRRGEIKNRGYGTNIEKKPRTEEKFEYFCDLAEELQYKVHIEEILL